MSADQKSERIQKIKRQYEFFENRFEHFRVDNITESLVEEKLLDLNRMYAFDQQQGILCFERDSDVVLRGHTQRPIKMYDVFPIKFAPVSLPNATRVFEALDIRGKDNAALHQLGINHLNTEETYNVLHSALFG